MIIGFVGDVHGRWKELDKVIQQNPDVDLFIQVGDMGIMPNLGHIPMQDFRKPVLFIDGNHEDHDFLSWLVEHQRPDITDTTWYIPRASTFVINDVRFNAIGGAISIDSHLRTEGIDWWPTEVPSYKHLSNFTDLPAPDIVITHEGPRSVVAEMCNYDPDNTVSRALDSIRQMYPKPPQYWIFGHHHISSTVTLDGTVFVCVPCVHEWNNHKGGYVHKMFL